MTLSLPSAVASFLPISSGTSPSHASLITPSTAHNCIAFIHFRTTPADLEVFHHSREAILFISDDQASDISLLTLKYAYFLSCDLSYFIRTFVSVQFYLLDIDLRSNGQILTFTQLHFDLSLYASYCLCFFISYTHTM